MGKCEITKVHYIYVSNKYTKYILNGGIINTYPKNLVEARAHFEIDYKVHTKNRVHIGHANATCDVPGKCLASTAGVAVPSCSCCSVESRLR